MESAENGTGEDLQFHPLGCADCAASHGTAAGLLRNSGSETTMRSPRIVVTNPFTHQPTEMPLIERDHEIQTLASYGPDQSFTKCISLRRLWRRFQDPQPEALYKLLIEFRREDRITVMDDEAMLGLARKSFPKLLQGPCSRGVGRHIALQDTSGSELEDNKHVEELELAVTATMKSQATIASAWLRTNVAQFWGEVLFPRPSSRPHGQYFRTVRGDTRMPSLR